MNVSNRGRLKTVKVFALLIITVFVVVLSWQGKIVSVIIYGGEQTHIFATSRQRVFAVNINVIKLFAVLCLMLSQPHNEVQSKHT